MKTTEEIEFDSGVFCADAFPFWVAIILVCGLCFSFGAFLFTLASPVMILVSMYCLIRVWRKKISKKQKTITVVLDTLALGFYGFMTLIWVMFLRHGPLINLM